MIGYGGAHWSFVYDSEASLDEGEKITDLGSGRFVTAAVTQGFAPLDRYLMGFAPASDVADTFVALNPSVSPLGHPQSGVAFTGTRLNISVNDVIQAAGPAHSGLHGGAAPLPIRVHSGGAFGHAELVADQRRAAGGNLSPAVRGGVHEILRQPGHGGYHVESQRAAVAVSGGGRGGRG